MCRADRFLRLVIVCDFVKLIRLQSRPQLPLTVFHTFISAAFAVRLSLSIPFILSDESGKV